MTQESQAVSKMLDPHLQSQLIEAIKACDVTQIEAWLQAGADPNGYIEGEKYCQCPMLVAAHAGSTSVLEKLRVGGGRIDSRGSNAYTPLMSAAVFDQVDAGRWLIQQGADLGILNSFRQTPLMVALAYERFQFVEMVLAEKPESRSGHLLFAARRSLNRLNINVAQWLIKEGISPDLTAENGQSWLSMAQSNREDLSRPLTDLLLDAGAAVNGMDANGRTPMHEACRVMNDAALLRLLNAGADPDIADREGLTVRARLHAMDPGSKCRTAFEAWEASHRAHRTIEAAANSTPVRPL